MKAIIFGDLHGEVQMWKPVLKSAVKMEPDLFLLVGDIGATTLYKEKDILILEESGRTISGVDLYKESIREIKAMLDETGVPWFCVPGNHDEPNFYGLFEKENIDKKLVEFKGKKFYGFGGSLGRGIFPNEFKEEDIRDHQFPDADFYLLHSPPSDCKLDKTKGIAGGHIGSRTLRALLKTSKGVFACGHCHEAAGIEKFYRSLGVNAGSFGDPYADSLFAVWISEERRFELWRHYNEHQVVILEAS